MTALPGIDTDDEGLVQRTQARDELAFVGLLAARALARGRADGWIAEASGPLVAVDGGDEQLRTLFARIERRLDERLAAGAPLPMDTLRRRFGLSVTEQRVLWALYGFDVDPRVRQLVRHLQTEDTHRLTVGTLLALVYQELPPGVGLAELGPGGALARLGLIDLGGAADAPVSQRTVRAADRVLEMAGGLVRLDPQVEGCARLLHDLSPPGSLVGDEAAARAVCELVAAAAASPAPFAITLLVGPEGSGRRSLAQAAAARAGLPVLAVRCRELPGDAARCERFVRALAREAVFFGALLLLEDIDALAGDAEQEIEDRIAVLERAGLSALSVPIVATASPGGRPLSLSRGTTVVELGIPLEGARADLWRRALGADAPDAVVAAAATRYGVTGGTILRAAAVALASRGARGGALDAADVHAGIRTVIDTRLGGMGARVATTQRWDDLVLPPETLAELREMVARVKHRRRVYEDWGFARKVQKGLGVTALFSGPPGTGKTMVAGLVAAELGLDLYQIDLSRVVSKWIGETEKNLATLFAAAEAGHAVLLFDEADALFARRTEVKSSTDRYANLEVNYLLMRMEQFAGITILTTNHDTTIDDAFRRRLSFRVAFDAPEVAERERLWQALLPPDADVDGHLDFAGLADRYEVTGGYIRNCALRAAFLAADEDAPISMRHLERAATQEMAALGKVVMSAQTRRNP